jgi:uncharacterized SAM-binding protein YcdF (DUF218 family)
MLHNYTFTLSLIYYLQYSTQIVVCILFIVIINFLISITIINNIYLSGFLTSEI